MRNLIILLALAPVPAAAQVRWGTDFEAAKRASVTSKKPILIDFMASWCGPCRKMDEETFPNPQVKALLQRMELVRLDVDRRPPQARSYSVTSIPRLILLPPGGGQPIVDVLGFADVPRLLEELGPVVGLKVALEGKPEESPALTRVRQALETDRYAVLKAAEPKLAAEGLKRIVEQLGVMKEADYPPIIALIRKAGSDVTPALILGLGHTHLAVRAGAYRALQEMASVQRKTLPPFDLWAPIAVRRKQLSKWK